MEDISVSVIKRRFLDGSKKEYPHEPVHSANQYMADVGYLLGVIESMKPRLLDTKMKQVKREMEKIVCYECVGQPGRFCERITTDCKHKDHKVRPLLLSLCTQTQSD